MKKFTTEEIRTLLVQVVMGEINLSRMVGILNEMVSEAGKPNFKEGDFLHSDWDDENITIIFKNRVCDNLYYHASKSCYFGVVVSDDRYWRDGGDFRIATEAEKQEFLDALAKEGKRWNAEKKCIEDIPVLKFQKGDKVMLKSGYKKDDGEITYDKFFDRYIDKPLTVAGYTMNGYISLDEHIFPFSDDWLEPYVELKKGDLAIFWDDSKKYAIIRFYERLDESKEYLQHIDQNGSKWENAIKFESIEQYERFIKGEI